MKVWVTGVAVLGPGLPDGRRANPILAGVAPWERTEASAPPPAILGPTERRRTSPAVRFALAAATEATAADPTAQRSRRSSPAAMATAPWWSASWTRCMRRRA
jgi:hypothetical protein